MRDMTRVCIADWEFEIDLTRTMEYSAAEAAEHCTCAYCRNFYAAIDRHYPDLRPFLAHFGVNIEAPDEQMPYDIHGGMVYDSIYLVYGQICKRGKTPIFVNDAQIQAYADQTDAGDSIFADASFVLDVGSVVLPWVLDEPMEETLSTANDPAFLQKMQDRLLEKQQTSNFES